MDIYLSMYEMGFNYPPPADTTLPPFHQHRYAILNRAPRPLVDITNLTRPFRWRVWVLIFASVSSTAVFIVFSYEMYARLEEGLVKKGVQPGQLVIRVVGSLTEPDRIHHSYFAATSSGRAKACSV